MFLSLTDWLGLQTLVSLVDQAGRLVLFVGLFLDSAAVVRSRSGFWDRAHARSTAGSVDGYRALSGRSRQQLSVMDLQFFQASGLMN